MMYVKALINAYVRMFYVLCCRQIRLSGCGKCQLTHLIVVLICHTSTTPTPSVLSHLMIISTAHARPQSGIDPTSACVVGL